MNKKKTAAILLMIMLATMLAMTTSTALACFADSSCKYNGHITTYPIVDNKLPEYIVRKCPWCGKYVISQGNG